MAGFFKKIKKVFYGHYPLSAIILLAVTVILACWQTVFLYFWADDWDLFLKIIHPNLSPWGLDPGWFGSGPYKYIHTPFMPLFPFFGLNPGPYFAIAIFIYFLTAVSIFLLVSELTRNKYLSLGISVIYASLPYIGSYTIFHLSNSYQNYGATLFTTLTLWLLAKYYRQRKIPYYLLSILLFFISIEVEHLRSHGLIFLVAGLTLLYGRWKRSFTNIFMHVIRFIPFALLYKIEYSSTLTQGGNTTVGGFFTTLIRDKTFAYFTYPFASFSNILIPDQITAFVYSLFGHVDKVIPQLVLVILFCILIFIISIRAKITKTIPLIFLAGEIGYFFFNQYAFTQSIIQSWGNVGSFTSMLGATLLLFIFFVSFLWWQRAYDMGKFLLLGVIIIFGHYIGYFVGVPSYSYLVTTDRYLTPSTVGAAIVLGLLFFHLTFRKFQLFAVLTALYALYLILLMNAAAYTTIHQVSIPTRHIYDTIRRITPSIPKTSILLLDIENGTNLKYIVGSSFPSTAFSLFYGFPDRVPQVRSMEEFLYNVKNGTMKINDLVGFYIGQWDVIDTTKSIRTRLNKPSEDKPINISAWKSDTPFVFTSGQFSTSNFLLSRQNEGISVSPEIEGDVLYPSVVPALLTLTISATPKDVSGAKFPLYDITPQVFDDPITKEIAEDVPVKANKALPCGNISFLLQLEAERKDQIGKLSIDTSSQTQYSEKDFLNDGLFSTNWAANIVKWAWAPMKKEFITIDMQTQKTLHRLIWINNLERTTPTEYALFVSSDAAQWTKVKEVRSGKARQDREVVVEEFSPTLARFIKMEIYETNLKQPPAVAEIWPSFLSSPGPFVYAANLINNPMECPVETKSAYDGLFSLIGYKVKASLFWLTDSRPDFDLQNTTDFEVIADGAAHTYQLFIPAGGTTLQKIRLKNFQLPLAITVEQASIRSLSFQELDDLGYIKRPNGSTN